jgi:hypothetical protein
MNTDSILRKKVITRFAFLARDIQAFELVDGTVHVKLYHVVTIGSCIAFGTVLAVCIVFPQKPPSSAPSWAFGAAGGAEKAKTGHFGPKTSVLAGNRQVIPARNHPRSVKYSGCAKKQFLERQGEVMLLRGWKSLSLPVSSLEADSTPRSRAAGGSALSCWAR